MALASLAPAFAHVAVDGQIADVTHRIASRPRDASLYLHRGELHRVHRDWEAARADYERARAIDPSMSGVDLCFGRMLLESGRPIDAVAALDRYLAAKPESPEGFAVRARSLVKLGRGLEAAADYTRAIELGAVAGAPSDPDLHVERARALAAEGGVHAAEAISGLDEGSARLGYPVTLEMEAIDLELFLGRHDAALQRLDRLLARSPRKESWMCRRGEILEAAGRSAEARDAYVSALRAIDALPSPRRGTRAMGDLERRIRSGLDRLATSVTPAEDRSHDGRGGAPGVSSAGPPHGVDR
jgi:predicted Zn-dependent protease